MPKGVEGATILLESESKKWQEKDPSVQRTPLELPTSHLAVEGKIVQVQDLFRRLLRAAGAEVKGHRAPRGAMARLIKPKQGQ